MLMQTLCKKGMKMKKAVNTLNLYLPFLTFHDGTCCAGWNFADTLLRTYFYGTLSLNVTGIFLFHQSCAMFLLIQSLKNGSLKDTVSPSTSMKSLAINAFLILCTLAEFSRRYSFSTSLRESPVLMPFATDMRKFFW